MRTLSQGPQFLCSPQAGLPTLTGLFHVPPISIHALSDSLKTACLVLGVTLSRILSKHFYLLSHLPNNSYVAQAGHKLSVAVPQLYPPSFLCRFNTGSHCVAQAALISLHRRGWP